MMLNSPITLLRSGILSGDWNQICESYFLLTAERLTPPAVAKQDEGGWCLSEEAIEKMLSAIRENLRQPWLPMRTPEAVPSQPAIPASPTPAAPVPAKPPPVKDEYDQYRVEHGQSKKRTDGKVGCRVLPFEPGGTNEWTDDCTVAPEEIAESKHLSETKSIEPRRPPVRHVNVTCCKCGNDYTVPPVLAPRKLEQGETNSYVCDGCIRSNRGRK